MTKIETLDGETVEISYYPEVFCFYCDDGDMIVEFAVKSEDLKALLKTLEEDDGHKS